MTDNSRARAVDPENLLLWRMNRRRLEIESLRDSMLMAAGRLDLQAGGIPFSLTAQPSVPRRSVYGFIERGRLPGFLSAFDFASPDQHAPLRFVTTVPQQALFFLNSRFVVEQARHASARPEVAGAETDAKKVERLYRIVFGRSPEPRELEAGLVIYSRKVQRTTGRRVFLRRGSTALHLTAPTDRVWIRSRRSRYSRRTAGKAARRYPRRSLAKLC